MSNSTLELDPFHGFNYVDPSYLNLGLRLRHAFVREKLMSAYFTDQASLFRGGFGVLARLLATFFVIGYSAEGAKDHLIAALEHVVARAAFVGFFVLARVDGLLRRENLIMVPEAVANPVQHEAVTLGLEERCELVRNFLRLKMIGNCIL